MIGASITKCEPTVKKYLGFTLIPQAGVALGLAASAKSFFSSTSGIGGESGSQMGELIYTCIIVSTIIYELIGPLVTKWALKQAGEIEKSA